MDFYLTASSQDQYTPLHAAAASGHLGVVTALLDLGASLHAANRAGNTPLHTAVLNGHVDVVQVSLLVHQVTCLLPGDARAGGGRAGPPQPPGPLTPAPGRGGHTLRVLPTAPAQRGGQGGHLA